MQINQNNHKDETWKKILTMAMTVFSGLTLISLCVLAVIFIPKSFSSPDSRPVIPSESSSPNCLAKDATHFYRLFASKTTYTAAYDNLDKLNVTIPQKCQPKMIYLFQRHGIRYPDGEDIPEMEQLLTRLQEEVLTASTEGRTSLCTEDIEMIRKWKNKMKVEDDNSLTDSGIKEIQEIAKRLLTRFPSILSPLDKKADVAVSSRERTNQSAFAFVKTLYDWTKNPLDYEYSVKPDLTDFHTTCEKHLNNQGVFLKKTPTYNDFLESATMENVRKRVSSRLGLSYTLSKADFKTLSRGCSFGLAIYNDTTWCSPFTQTDLRLMELLEDLDDFFGDAYGRDINTKFPCSLVKDMVSKVESFESSDGSSQPTTAFLRFSHAGAMKPLVSYFGLFDTFNMNVEDTCQAKTILGRSREWRSSLISPFSANFVLVLFDCKTDGKRVLTLLQEQPVTIKGCHSPLCPVEQFVDQYKPSANECRLDRICRL